MANRVRNIFENMSWMMASQIITSVAAFVWTIIMARYLGVSDFGIFGTAVSFYAIFAVINDFGISPYIVRSISTDEEQEPKYLGVGLSLKIILTILYFLTVFIALLILGWDNYIVSICLLFALEDAIKAVYTFFYMPFQAHEKMKYQAISNIIVNVLTFLFIVLVTFTDWALWGVAFAYIAANIIAGIYTVIAVKKHIFLPKLMFDIDFSKNLIISGIPFALSRLGYTIYYSIDMVMLTQFVGGYFTGLYNSSYKIISVLALFYSIYTAVVFPVMSKLFKDEKSLLNMGFNKSVKYLSLVTIPLSIATLFYAGDVISIIYGNQYSDSANVLKILIWTVCFLFINGASSLVLEASHKEFSVTKIYAIAALFNVSLNLILIPKYNVFGASIATVLSEILILSLELYVLSKINQLPDKKLVLDISKIVISSILLGIFLYFANLNIWFAVPIGIMVYFVFIVLLRTFDEDDKFIFKQILNK